MTPPGQGPYGPQGHGKEDNYTLLQTIHCYKEDHYTLLHTKYESFGPCGFGEEEFFKFGAGLFLTPGA